ncbi:MAG: hypothetical protein ABGW74_07155 [Campylobacterales bacterium]
MAKRPIFIPLGKPHLIEEKLIEFKYFNGFSITQKSKSINSLHQSAKEYGYKNILEVSTKSGLQIGWALSAFNLMLDFEDTQISVECAFQGSKVFENDIQYTDLYYVESIQAKKDNRLRNSGDIIGFSFRGDFWDNEPKTAFYDWLYIDTLYNNYPNLVEELLNYEAFTDIEFNPKKSINCQARSCAILVALIKEGFIEKALQSKEYFIDIIYGKRLLQKSLF